MPRPTKEFLDYFPFYCQGDERTDLLKAKKGMTGFGIYISLLVKLYGEKGYYLNWNDNICCIFASGVGVSEEEVSETVSLLINVGIFDKGVYENYGVLTSKEIQENYLFAVTKRKNKELDKRFNLVSVEETPVSGEETPVSVTESTQIKENKRKENKRIEKERGQSAPSHTAPVHTSEQTTRNDDVKFDCDIYTASPSPAPTPSPMGTMDNVILTANEYEQLKSKYPDIDPLIDRFSVYMASTGKEYPSHYATLIRWAEEDMTRTSIAPVYKPYTTKQPVKTKAASYERESSFDIDEFYQFAVSRDPRSCLT